MQVISGGILDKAPYHLHDLEGNLCWSHTNLPAELRFQKKIHIVPTHILNRLTGCMKDTAPLAFESNLPQPVILGA